MNMIARVIPQITSLICIIYANTLFNKHKTLSTTIRGIDLMFCTLAIQPYKKELLIGFSELFFVFSLVWEFLMFLFEY